MSARMLLTQSMVLVVLMVVLTQWSFAGVRLGGGRPMGHQHSTSGSGAKNAPSNAASNQPLNAAPAVAPATPSAPGAPPPAQTPANSNASSASATHSTAPSPATSAPPATGPKLASPVSPPTSSFGGFASRMLMGAALGFGMVSLAHALGLGSEHAQGFTMLLLLMLIVLFGYGFWRYVFKRPSFQSDGLAPNFMNSHRMGANGQSQAPLAVLGRTYNPKNVGNDASARPWESQGTLFSEASAVKEESSQRAVQKPFAPQQLSLWDSPSITPPTPPTPAVKLVDVEQFIAMSKDHFLQLQDAWDHLDIERLSSFLSPEMFTLVKAQLAQLGLKPQKTEVMMLQAQWLGYETAGDHHIASVELSGMSREAEEASFSPFREIWSWTRPIADERAAWLVCGLEPLQ